VEGLTNPDTFHQPFRLIARPQNAADGIQRGVLVALGTAGRKLLAQALDGHALDHHVAGTGEGGEEEAFTAE